MRIANVSTPVLVLGAHQHGSLGIIRSLGELGVNVYGTFWPERGPATYSRYCQYAFPWEFTPADPKSAVQELHEIGRQIGRPAILIPTWDETAVFVAEHYESLSRSFILPKQDPQLARNLVDKRAMYDLAKKHGIPTAEIAVPKCLAEVEEFARTATFPLMLKGIDGNRLKQMKGIKMEIVRTAEELVRRYAELEDPAGPNLMLQELIPASEEPNWMFNGYFNENSECLVGYTGKKLRQTPVYIGMTSLGVCCSNPIIAERTISFMEQLGYRGILDIGFRYDYRDGEYKVLDINPRIGATFRLFVGKNGLDVARALYLDLTGQLVPSSAAREGRKWMVELDFQSCLHYYRDGNLTIPNWLRSLRGIEEFGYCRRDDLRPVFALATAAMKRAVAPAVALYRRALAAARQRRRAKTQLAAVADSE